MFPNKLIYLFFVICFVIYPTVCLSAPEINVTASIDKTKINLDEFLQFTVTIEETTSPSVNPRIKLPKLQDNFVIVASSQSTSTNFQGGQAKTSWQLQYTLSPKKEGEIKIESAEIVYEGLTYKTQELTVSVTVPKTPQKIPKEIPSKKFPWPNGEGISI